MSQQTPLHFLQVPAKQPSHHAPLFFLHGLFGYGRNWMSIARQFPEYTCILPDLRNHGQSFHAQDFSLKAMAQDLEQLREYLGFHDISLIGHSLGGKVAMQYAHDFGLSLQHLFIIDIAPRVYALHEHHQLIQALHQLNLKTLRHRDEADNRLKASIPVASVRQFLLSNLRQDKETGIWSWQMNLERMTQDLSDLQGVPQARRPFTRCPVFFIAGQNSDYVTAADQAQIQQQFPKATCEWIEGAGHWIHAEQPQALVKSLKKGLDLNAT
jgi:esterase